MICPICKTDISKPEQQFGGVKRQICQSCYLAGNEWVNDDPEILDYLKTMSLEDAMLTVNTQHIKELTRQLGISASDLIYPRPI